MARRHAITQVTPGPTAPRRKTRFTTKLTSLVTTSVFVVAVAIALAYFMKDAQTKDIIGATAAYAAVLVVFVGTGTGTTR